LYVRSSKSDEIKVKSRELETAICSRWWAETGARWSVTLQPSEKEHILLFEPPDLYQRTSESDDLQYK
jgi:hypothetical protein